jgi:hypothetical protein
MTENITIKKAKCLVETGVPLITHHRKVAFTHGAFQPFLEYHITISMEMTNKGTRTSVRNMQYIL